MKFEMDYYSKTVILHTISLTNLDQKDSRLQSMYIQKEIKKLKANKMPVILLNFKLEDMKGTKLSTEL